MEKEAFLNKLKIELKISKNSPYTIRNYIHSNRDFIDFIQKPPEEINEDDLKYYLSEKLSENSSSSIILFLSAIRYSFSIILKNDITLNIKRPRREKRLPTVLSKQEIKSLLDTASTRKSKLILSLIYACGFRVSELINLKTEDMDFEEMIGYVRQSKGRKDRIFNIPLFLEKKLKKQVQRQKEFNQEFLFTGPKGKLTSRAIQKMVKSTSLRSGISKDVHTHTLRHSFATHLLENNVDIRKIQELLGHSNLSTTQIYTHISTEELKKIKSPIDSL